MTVIAVPHVLDDDKTGVGGVDGYTSTVTVLLGPQPPAPAAFAAKNPQAAVKTYFA